MANVLPGTYISRAEEAIGLNPPGAPLGLCLIGTGSRSKRVTDEAVVKGLVAEESVTPATFTMPGSQITGNASEARVFTLANAAVRDADLVTIRRTMSGNVSTLSYGRGDWEFLPAFVTPASDLSSARGAIGATAALASSFSLDIDGMSMTIALQDSGGVDPAYLTANDVTLYTTDGGRVGHHVLVTANFSASATVAQIAAAVSIGVHTYAQAIGSTVDYSSCAFAGTNGLTIFSQIEGPESGVAVYAGFANNACTTFFGGALSASSRIQLSVVGLGTSATFEVDYVAASDSSDDLANEPTRLRSVGSAAGRADFDEGEDFTRSGNTLTWSADAATLTSGVSSLRLGRTVVSSNVEIAANVLTITVAANHGLQIGEYITFNAADNSADITSALPITDLPTSTTIEVANHPTTTLASAADIGAITLVAISADALNTFEVQNDSFGWSIDSKPAAWVDLISPAAAAEPFGFSASLTQAGIVQNLNAFAVRDFGPRYASTASVVTVAGSSVIRLTSYLTGSAANITLTTDITNTDAIGSAATQAAAIEALFGATTYPVPADLPPSQLASPPAQGDTYYVTYDYDRPTDEYVVRYSFTDLAEAYAQIGRPDAEVAGYNQLAVALEVADQVGVSEVSVIQINDVTSPGSPTISEIQDALAEAELEGDNTEIVLVGAAGARTDAWAELLAHVENQSGAEENHPRRGYAGAASSTAIGTTNEEGTLLWAPARAFSVASTSDARGRMFFAVGPKRSGAAVQFDTRLLDGSPVTLDLDHTFVAVAAAADRVRRPSAADSLTNEPLIGVFKVPAKKDSWNDRELKRLVRGSCLVLASNGAQLRWVEGLTTERAGAAAASFEIDTGTVQDDVLRLKIKIAMDRALIGLEPISIPTFIFDCKMLLKSIIENVISAGDAGHYLNSDGSIRELDMDRDISFKAVRGDPRRFRFTYSVNRRFAVGVIEGSYTPDRNLFAALATSGV